jgi:hypothetical protein
VTKKFILIAFQLFSCCWIALCENPRWRIPDEIRIPARDDLVVRWGCSIEKVPQDIWVYHLLPHHFSEPVVSNVLSMCSFSYDAEVKHNGDALVVKSRDGALNLSVIVGSGIIHYRTKEVTYGPNNLTKGVPSILALPTFATNFVRALQIPISEVTGFFGTDQFNFSEPMTMYYVGDTTVTNVTFRSVKFRRCVDDIPFVGGDSGSFDVGANGKIIRLDFEWHELERRQRLRTLSAEEITDVLRLGKAYQGLLPMNGDPIDWLTVKKVTIKKALPCYFSGSTGTLFPFLVLFTSIDTGDAVLDAQIECPIVDETKMTPIKN